MSKSIQIGDKCPSFSLKDQHGEVFNSDEIIGDNNMVVYFYPKDETAGCTKQACSFKDAYTDFTAAGALVVGISSDDEESHKALQKTITCLLFSWQIPIKKCAKHSVFQLICWD